MSEPPPSRDDDFNFPVTPYPVQRQLMAALYAAMDARHVGLFESPTGTGKTLSMICATLTWLTRNPIPISPSPSLSATHGDTADTEPAWVSEQLADARQRDATNLQRRRARAYQLRVQRTASVPLRLPRPRHTNQIEDLFGDLTDSDSDGKKTKAKTKAKVKQWKQKESNEQDEDERDRDEIDKVYDRTTGTDNGDAKEGDKLRAARVVFATRTHTQISQFVHELRRTKFSPSSSSSSDTLSPPLSVLVFGSRKQMCINDSVNTLPSPSAVTDRCQQLNDSSTTTTKRKRSTGCPFHTASSEAALADTLLTGRAPDMEDVLRSGRAQSACPYYAVRRAVTTGVPDVLVVPYAAVLHEPTARALGLTMDEQTVLVFDEAHNVAAAVKDMHAATVTKHGMKVTCTAFETYIDTLKHRLSVDNLFRVRQASAVAHALLAAMPGEKENEQGESDDEEDAVVVNVEDLIFDAGIDNVNLVDLSEYLSQSRLCNKLRGYLPSSTSTSSSSSTADAFQRFVAALSGACVHARVAARRDSLRVFVVDAAPLFARAVARCRSILLLGGTLSPRAALTDHLLRDLPHVLSQFECQHVVPWHHVVARAVPSPGPLTVARRRFRPVWTALAAARAAAPQGFVVFFASYNMLSAAMAQGEGVEVMKDVATCVFTEERRKGGGAVGGSDVLRLYTEAVEKGDDEKPVLLAVMGGKLSEGMNFSDGLARVVAAVGVPFMNARAPETRETLRALQTQRKEKGGEEWMLNEAMVSVNQCIGRAVRHKGDYAAVLLVDERYTRAEVRQRLPRFIRRDFEDVDDDAQLSQQLGAFFASHV